MSGEDQEDVTGQDVEKDNDSDAKGSLHKDEPEIGKGTGEGDRGLGVDSGAAGGEHPTEPEDAEVERGQSSGADGG